MRKIAFYGKGGIGKSTIAGSLSYGLSMLGYKVMQIGCDPKADSTINLTNGQAVTPIMRYLKEHTICPSLEEIVVEGNNGILCLESGGPTAGLGCAGRGIIATFNVLEDLHAFEVYQPDFVIYDVLGDVVCGGFAMPIRKGFADEVIIVTSGEKMSMFAAGNIKQAIDNFSDRNYARLRGLILNRRNIENEEAIVREFARTINAEIIGDIPRDNNIQFYEQQNKTVLQGDPDLPISQIMLDIARRIAVNGG
ncbi:MAG: nitrogenase iron protein NifH [Desulfobacteraceae bacterium]|jgi:nitrogenase iron protein NifH